MRNAQPAHLLHEFLIKSQIPADFRHMLPAFHPLHDGFYRLGQVLVRQRAVYRRFPRRFVTGCHILETPLCRLTGVCVLMFSSSGAFLILPGFESKDAQHVARLLALGEGQP